MGNAKDNQDNMRWPGFYAPLYTQVPDELFDFWLPRLSESELKVLLYIIRRTFGFKKESDNISLSQMVEGIVTRAGKRLDYGAGVSATAVKGAIKGLLAKDLIERQHNESAAHGHEATTYRLRLRATPTPPWPDLDQALSQNMPKGETESDQALGLIQATQETVVQETVSQEYDQTDLDSGESTSGVARYSPYIAAIVLDHSRELGDGLRGPQNVTDIHELWQASGLVETEFVQLLHTARSAARNRPSPHRHSYGTRRIELYFETLRQYIS